MIENESKPSDQSKSSVQQGLRYKYDLIYCLAILGGFFCDNEGTAKKRLWYKLHFNLAFTLPEGIQTFASDRISARVKATW